MALDPLDGLRVVDLYAGSGALGIEALSRGAVHADFVEADRNARRVLDANLDRLGLRDRATVWPLELPRGLGRIAPALHAADLVLLDPPYGGAAGQVEVPVGERVEGAGKQGGSRLTQGPTSSPGAAGITGATS